MYSDVIKSRLEHEVVGQTRAVNSIVRGVTRVVSGLTPRERTFCAYMLIGPAGTGKTLLIQTLARILHGDDSRVIVIDSGQLSGFHPGIALATQLMPLYGQAQWNGRQPAAVAEPSPLGIVRVENLERGDKDAHKALAAVLETGQVALPDGRRGSLGNSILFLTSSLCAREILDEPTIGFSGTPADEEDDGHEKLYGVCFDEAQKQFGGDLMSRLDRMVVFHALTEEHMASILDRRFQRLTEWLIARGFHCELQPTAREFLLERGKQDVRRGAYEIARAHQRFVEFPVADLLVSGRIPVGGVVSVDRIAGEEHLHFTVTGPGGMEGADRSRREIPVRWETSGARA